MKTFPEVLGDIVSLKKAITHFTFSGGVERAKHFVGSILILVVKNIRVTCYSIILAIIIR